MWGDFRALTPEERDRYGRGKLLPVLEDRERQEEFWRKYGRNASAFNDYYMRRIVAEMDTRDREWVYTGKSTPIDYSEKPREKYGVLIDPDLPISERYALFNITGKDNEKKDVFVHDMLSGNGFRVQVHETIENGGFTNIDLDLNGNRCEVKSPEAKRNPGSKDELKLVQRNVQAARHQFAKEVSRCESRMVMSNYYTEFEGEKEELVIDRYRKELNLQGFTEGLFIRKDGSIVRVK